MWHWVFCSDITALKCTHCWHLFTAHVGICLKLPSAHLRKQSGEICGWNQATRHHAATRCKTWFQKIHGEWLAKSGRALVSQVGKTISEVKRTTKAVNALGTYCRHPQTSKSKEFVSATFAEFWVAVVHVESMMLGLPGWALCLDPPARMFNHCGSKIGICVNYCFGWHVTCLCSLTH